MKGIPKIIPHPHPDIRPRAVTRTPSKAKEVLVRTVSALERKAMAMRMKTMKLRKMRFMSWVTKRKGRRGGSSLRGDDNS